MGPVFSSPAVDAKAGFGTFCQKLLFSPAGKIKATPYFYLLTTALGNDLIKNVNPCLKAACDQHTTP